MSIDFVIRLIGMVVFTIGGVFWGISIGTAAQGSASAIKMNIESVRVHPRSGRRFGGFGFNSLHHHPPFPVADECYEENIRSVVDRIDDRIVDRIIIRGHAGFSFGIAAEAIQLHPAIHWCPVIWLSWDSHV